MLREKLISLPVLFAKGSSKMSILVAQTRDLLFSGEITLENYLAYVMRPDSTRYNLIYGIGVNTHNAFYDMKAVKYLFYNEHRNTLAGKWFHEYILSLDWRYDSTADEGDFFECCKEVGHTISTHNGVFQVLFAVHINTGCIHSHFIVNNIDCHNGRRLRSSYDDLFQLKRKIDQILSRFGYTIIRKDREIKDYREI